MSPPSTASLVDTGVRSLLEEASVPWCLIGAHALALHGVARYTADVDILCMNSRVLEPAFWAPWVARGNDPTRVVIRRGDEEDPLAGLVRLGTTPPLDLVVGKGPLMRSALEHATIAGDELIPVVTALELALLKLEAGGPRDISDVRDLLDALALRGDMSLAEALALRELDLSDWGRRALERVRSFGAP